MTSGYKRWQDLKRFGLTRKRIMDFHASHKYLLMAHSQSGAKALGNLLGQSDRGTSATALGARYFDTFSQVMQRKPTRQSHTNVLHHLAGYFSEQLSREDREELSRVIENYRLERLPLIVPITLIRHYVRKFNVEYLINQVYLDPYLDELNLVNQL